MKKLTVFLKGYRCKSVLGPLFKLFEASLELIVPLVIAALIDNGIHAAGGADKPYIVKCCIMLAVLGAVGLIFSVTAQYFAAAASCGFTSGLRSALFTHIQSLSYSELDKIGTSTLITRMTSDTNQVQTGLNLTLRLLLRSPFVVFGAMIMAFTVDAPSAVNFVVVIPLLSIVVFGIMLISMPLYKKTQARLDSLVSKTRDGIEGARVIRAFAKENDEIRDFEERNDALTDMQKFVGKISALMNPLTFVLINAAVIALIYTGALRVDNGDLTQGQVVALYNYMSQILVELVKLANLIISITKALASANRISSVLNTECSMTYGKEELVSVGSGIEFSGVSLAYGGAQDSSLEDISFHAERGQTIGIIGATGSGKSSLINLIARFYDATQGSVTIDGKPISAYTKESLGKRIGVVPQRALLFSGTIGENLRWAKPDATDEEIYEAARVAQCESVILDKGGLDAEIEQGGRNLSGGQRQRLTIARALVGKPEVLILDDSASALDYATDAALRTAIANETKGTTVFIVSQRASSVMNADQILVLDDGRIVNKGTHSELLQSSDIYREIYETQFTKEAAV